MPKKSIPSKRAKIFKLQLWIVRHKIVTLVLAAVVLIAAFAGVKYMINRVEIAHERAQFMQAKIDLHNVYNKVVAQVGQPDEHKSVQSCEYTNSEFTRGYRYCDIDEYAVYSNEDLSNARITSNSISNLLSKFVNAKNVETSPIAARNINVMSLKFNNRFSFNCTSDHWYIDGSLPFSTYGFSPLHKTGLFVDISCKAPAKAEYFPVIPNN